MKAFKTFNSCPEEKRPANIPLNYVWKLQEFSSLTEDQEADLTASGFTIMTDEDYDAYLQTNVVEFSAYEESLNPTQSDLDKIKYLKRSKALANMIAEMATENVARIRSGEWTVNQLISLTQDAGVKEVLTDLSSLSFEIAYGKIDNLTPEFLTPEIKTAWKNKLAANFFNS